MPQGAGPSSDLFNIHTDPQLRGTKGVYKNVDDILTAAPTPGQLEHKMEQVLKVCRKRNMKLSPSKFQCARQVTFGGVNIEALKQRGDTETRVYLTPEDEKIQKFLDIEEPKTKKDAQMICGMAAQLKAWVPGLQLIYPNIQKLTSNTTPFTWSADLSLEFQAMKRAIQESHQTVTS